MDISPKRPITVPTPEEKSYLIKQYEEHLEVLTETIFYARQDLDAFYQKLDLTHPEKRQEAQRVVDDLDREMAILRENLSKLRAGEGI